MHIRTYMAQSECGKDCDERHDMSHGCAVFSGNHHIQTHIIPPRNDNYTIITLTKP